MGIVWGFRVIVFRVQGLVSTTRFATERLKELETSLALAEGLFALEGQHPFALFRLNWGGGGGVGGGGKSSETLNPA